MKLLGSIEIKINKDNNGEIVTQLEITEIMLIHQKILNNDYQQDSRVLYTFISNKLFSDTL